MPRKFQVEESRQAPRPPVKKELCGGRIAAYHQRVSANETLTIDFRRAVPLFPLANCVLLPHATIPLHIFEPRYRKMTSDVLDSRGLIAMALFEGEGWRQDYEGSPPLRQSVCLGYIVDHQKLEDGRYNILLQGVCRAKIKEEVHSHVYRKAVLQPTEFPQPKEADLSEHRGRIEALLNDPLLGELESVTNARKWIENDIPTNALVDLSLMVFCDSIEERYSILVENDGAARAGYLESILQITRRKLGGVKRRKFPPM